ncbi:MAG TPA: hypothetical protein VNE82_08435 [Candidatus Binataceae bacterium]|nr:hypothetical protein [Candidatus Binataceae bacterium]
MLQENPVGQLTPGKSQVRGTHTAAVVGVGAGAGVADDEGAGVAGMTVSLRQVADSRPFPEQSELLEHAAPSQSPLTHALPGGQSLSLAHCPNGEQNPPTQGIEPGHWLELVHAFKLGMQ